jgi:hypothetical protein
MSIPRLHVAAQPLRARVPLSPFADRVRDALSLRASEMDELCPEALDLAAELVAALHEQLLGRATECRGNRGAGYFRQALRGEHPLTLEDIARLALEEPEALVPALSILAARIGRQLAPAPRMAPAAQAAADVASAAGEVSSGTLRALEDGVIDQAEAHALCPGVRRLADRVAILEASLAGTRSERTA